MHTWTQQLPFPAEDVFAWHARPGAVHRLTPPWQPIRVLDEATSLRDGQAVFGLPGGRRWVARHDPSAYVEGSRFADELVSRPFVLPVRWRHTHTIAPADGGAELTDRVETTAPARLVSPMSGYRHRQLLGDLTAHAWAAALRPESLTIAVTGSSGVLALRPEQLRLHREETAAGVPAQVETVSFHGHDATVAVVLDGAGARLLVRTTGPTATVGDRVRVTVEGPGLFFADRA